MITTILQSLFGDGRVLGTADVTRRIVATLVLGGLGIAVIPQVGVPFALQKIALLCTAELGLAGIMFGMFLGAKTYFSGSLLFAAPLLMLALIGKQHAYTATVVGLLFTAIAVASLVKHFTRSVVLTPAAASPERRAATTPAASH